MRWDIFCRVIDNLGDIGVCWRLCADLAARGEQVRLWIDQPAPLDWMAPGERSVEVLTWTDPLPQAAFTGARSDVWIEAFGCELPPAFVAHGVAQTGDAEHPAWINLEYLSAEDWVPRMHGLPSPVMSGPARGWTKRFMFPGFTPDTGGLLREADLLARQQAFDRDAWRARHAPDLAADGLLVSLFCYEPAGLPVFLHSLATTPHRLLVTPGRPLAALQAVAPPLPAWHALPYTDHAGFDAMLWACDLNFVRGEDSLVRALWAGQPLVWHIYPQDDNAHHAKLDAFLDWLGAPDSLRAFHHAWNGMADPAGATCPDRATWQEWSECARSARQRLLAQDDLVTQLVRSVTEKR
jgi:uncharacterized repeat protein (TIGR03837 family)